MPLCCLYPRFAASALALFAGAAAASPVVSGVTDASVPRSGRFVVTGSGFGVGGDGSFLELGGVRIANARWTDTAITGYVLGDTPVGGSGLRVVTPEGVSNEVPFTVEPLPAEGERIAWRFEADSAGFRHRSAVGADGTVYANDQLGFLYAIGPDGGLKWVYSTVPTGGGLGGVGPVAIGAEGTVYVVGDPLGPEVHLHAVNPDGTQRWLYVAQNAVGAIAGPNVGPDGNVYIVFENADGAVSLTPDGQVRWASQNTPNVFEEFGGTGEEIVFGSTVPGGAIDQLHVAFDMVRYQMGFPTNQIGLLFGLSMSDGAVRFSTYQGGQSIAGGQQQGQPAAGTDGLVYACGLIPQLGGWALHAFSADTGERRWTHHVTPGNTCSEPTVGPDGTVYYIRNTWHLHAVNPDGTPRWVNTGAVSGMTRGPIVSPRNDIIIAGGMTGAPAMGYIQAISTAGSFLWREALPAENGQGIWPGTRATFSPDGGSAYVGTVLAGQPAGSEHSYLYALKTDDPCEADLDGDGSLSLSDFVAFRNAYVAGSPAADFDQSGTLTLNDFVAFRNAYTAGCQ